MDLMADPTVGDVIARLFRTYLYPPDYQPATTFQATPVTDDPSDITWNLGEFAVPEDENLMRQGSIIESGQELAIVRQYSEDTNTVFVQRGEYKTPVEAHATGDPVILSPPYSRFSAFQAVADNIIQLYPRLSTMASANLVEVANGIAGLGDDLGVEVLSVWAGDYTRRPDIDAKIVDFHPAVGGRAVIMNVPSGSFWLRYRRRMGSSESETDLLKDLGVDPRWVNILVAGAAADLFAGRDLPASQVEWVSQVLQAENIKVGTRADLAVGLARYRELLIDRAEAEMDAEYGITVHAQEAISVEVRGGIG
jgi:hypothetical protein